MATVNDKPRPTHREALPIRECRQCGAYLRTGNERTTCDPCGIPEWERIDESIWERIATLPAARRRQAFTALDDLEALMEEPA